MPISAHITVKTAQILDFHQTKVFQHRLHMRITWGVFNTLPGPRARPLISRSQRMGLRFQYFFKPSPGDSHVQPGLRITDVNPALNLNSSTYQLYGPGHVCSHVCKRWIKMSNCNSHVQAVSLPPPPPSQIPE